MKKITLLIFLFLSFITNAQIEGTWNGNIEIPNAPLPFVIHITSENGILQATSDSPQQNVYGIKLKEILFKNNVVTISEPSMGMTYEGKLVGVNRINGKFKQGGFEFPLNLVKGNYEMKRPQEPKAPFAYVVEEVTFKNEKDGNILSGTLTKPNGKGKFPVIVLAQGTGPTNRNEEVLGHKPFWVIADYLTQNGYAVLRYDKRGIEKSTGDFATATVYDFANDSRAALTYLRTRKDINANKMGIAGHSEGGEVAQIVAASDPKLDFIILLGSPGVKGSELLLQQTAAIAKVMGSSDADIAEVKKINTRIYDIVMTNEDAKKGIAALNQYLKTIPNYANVSEQEIEEEATKLYSPHMRNLLLFDPQDYLPKIKCKVLAINGDKDLQVLADENLNAIKKGLAKNKNVTIKFIPNKNHLFQNTETGSPMEYGTLEETFSEEVLHDIVQWLNVNVK